MLEREERILDFAVAKETASEQYYLEWASRCGDPDLEKLLRELARDERGHIEKLCSVSPEALIAEGVAPAEFGLAEDLPEVVDESAMSILDALAVAIKREEEAIHLYERLRASSTEAALFTALVQEERRHKHKLELQYALAERRG